MRRRRWANLAVLGCAVLFVALSQARADDFPTRPLRMIIPAPAGGGTDIIFRVLAQVAERLLGEKIVVLNRPGASGTSGVLEVVRSDPDGYTIGGVWNAPLTISPHFLKVAYRPADYAAISLSARSAGVFCVRKDFPASDGRSFLAELKAQPGRYSYGNDGVGGTLHLAAERLFAAAGVKAVAVPFPGAGQNANSLLGGHTDIYAAGISAILPFVDGGTAKCLLVTSADRSAILPNTQGLSEVGFGASELQIWRGVIAPLGVPANRQAKLADLFRRAARDPEFVEFARKMGEEAVGSDPEAFRKLIDAQDSELARSIQDLHLGVAK